MAHRARCVTLGIGLWLTACASDDPPPAPAEGCGFGSVSAAGTTGFSEPVPVPGSVCGAVVTQEADAAGQHVPECSVIRHSSNPPAVGAHYGSWAAYRTYDTPVPRGFWVHSMEHGAVVLLHNCSDCADEIAAAAALIDELPEDVSEQCLAAGVRRKVILTPDPALDVRWAAAAWRFTLRSDCFEPEVFRAFASEHYGQGTERSCVPGREF